MTTPIRLPNGEEIEIATDDPKQAAAVAKNIWAKRQAASEPTKKPHTNAFREFVGEGVGAGIGNIMDNVLPNWGDEVAGLGALLGAYTGSGRDPKTAFADGQREFREQQEAYKAAHPVTSKATAVTGFGLGLAAPTGRVAQGGAAGAGYGAASGAGEGNGIVDRATNAARSASIGGAFGAAAAPVMDGAMWLGRQARQNIPGVDQAVTALSNVPRAILQRVGIGAGRIQPGQRAQEQADRILHREMNRGNIQRGMGQPGPAANPDAILTEVQNRQALGVPAMPGDVTEPMRNLTSWSSRGMGPGQTRVVQALDARKASEANRVRQHVIDEFGPVGDPLLQVEQHMQRAREQAAPMYRAAYNEPMVVNDEIASIMRTPAFQEAIPNAVRNIRNAQRDPMELGFRLHSDGTITAAETLSTEGFDQVIRAMRDNGRAAAEVNPLTGRVNNTTDSVHINARAGDLRQQLAAQNPAYREVTERYADDMAQRDAFQRGQDISSLTGHEINAQRRAMPENAQGSWSIGARTALADQASEFGAKYPTGDTAANLRKALGDDVKQQAIGEMTGNTGAVRGLQDRLEAEHQGNILWKDVQGNSKTASRQQLDADLDEAASGRLSNLSARGMLTGVINFIGDRASSQFRNDVKARIAEVATETNPATVQELMAEIAQRAQRDREFADLLHRAGVIGTKGYAVNIEPARPDGQVIVGYGQNEDGSTYPMYGRPDENTIN
jgi:hypothetical protein